MSGAYFSPVQGWLPSVTLCLMPSHGVRSVIGESAWRTVCARFRLGANAIPNSPTACSATLNIISRPKELAELRFAPYTQAYRDVPGARLNAKQCGLLELALCFLTWRTLVREVGLKQTAAVDVMVQAIDCARQPLG